jgi:hypothetical protein
VWSIRGLAATSLNKYLSPGGSAFDNKIEDLAAHQQIKIQAPEIPQKISIQSGKVQ